MAANPPPNILLIMDDQHRFDYLRCAGASFVRTPSIDALAAGGTRFTHCCTNAPLCAPARAALATGMQPWRLGTMDNDCYLPNKTPTYYQHLRDHGYRVGCAGKLDLAKAEPVGLHGNRPCVYGWGFTDPIETEGIMMMGAALNGPYAQFLRHRGLFQTYVQDRQARRDKGWVIGASNDSPLPADVQLDSFIGQKAVEWIDRIPSDYPWHLFVSFAGPHDPFDPPGEYASRYRKAKMPQPVQDSLVDKPRWVKNKFFTNDPAEILLARRQYCAKIELIDHHIGQILRAVKRRGMQENTIVIFSSDHGEMLGDHGVFEKYVAYEPSLRVPLIVAGPGIARGRTSDALIELIDINPTITDLAGLPPQQNLDAKSFAAIARSGRGRHREDVTTALHPFRALRTERYKLIENYGDTGELYDLKTDPHEIHNLIRKRPAIANRLQRRLCARYVEGKWLR